MKKQFILLTLFTLLAIMVPAANVTLFPVFEDSVKTYSASFFNIKSGAKNHHYIYGKTGDTLRAGSMVSTNNSSFWRSVDSLQPLTQYRIAAVVDSFGITDTSDFITFTTKPIPPPLQPTSITGIIVNSSWFQTAVKFTYRAIGYFFKATVHYGAFAYTSPTITLTGEGDTTIIITNPNVPGTTYSGNVIRTVPIGNVPPNITDETFSFGSYTVPLSTNVDVVNVSLSAATPDSMISSVTIHPGNAGYATAAVFSLDGSGNKIAMIWSGAIAKDTTFSVGFGGLSNYTPYAVRAIATNQITTDSAQSGFVRTLQVLPAVIVTWDTVQATTYLTKLKVTFNTSGTYVKSKGSGWVVYPDRNGILLTTDTVKNLVGLVDGIFSLINLRQGPSINPATIYFRNDAGLVTAYPIGIIIRSPRPGFETSWGRLRGNNASTITLENIGFKNANGGNILVMVRRGGSLTIDTLIGVSGVYGIGDVNIPVSGLIGRTEYWFQTAGQSPDGEIVFNPVWKSEKTTDPIAPVITEITINSVGSDRVTFTVRGDGNGTPTTIRMEILQNGILVKTMDSWNDAGTTTFEKQFSAGGLYSQTTYEIKVTPSGPNNTTAMPLSKSFTTTMVTAIQEVSGDPDRLVDVINPMGTGQVIIENISRSQIAKWCLENGYIGKPYKISEK